MTESDTDILIALEASPFRKYAAMGMLALLGILLLGVTSANPQSIAALVALPAAALASFWVAFKIGTGGRAQLCLSRTRLRTSDGLLIAEVANIRRVDRGMFAFKPSNGFVIHLEKPMPLSWNPGMWWRIGRRVGIGGITERGKARTMADIIALLLQEGENGRNETGP